MPRRRIGIAILAAALVTACGEKEKADPDLAWTCGRLQTPLEAIEARDRDGPYPDAAKRIYADWCVQRSAYILAASGERTELVAKAAVMACEDALDEAIRATHEYGVKQFGGPGSRVVPRTIEEVES